MKIFKLTLLAFALLSLSISACKKSGCTDAEAINYDADAKNDNGNCEYAFTRFVGTYNMNDTLYADAGPYFFSNTVIISENNMSPDKINIQLQSGASLVADVSGNTFIIPSQPVGSTEYFGNGNLSGNSLRLVYTYLNGLNTVNGTGEKQQ